MKSLLSAEERRKWIDVRRAWRADLSQTKTFAYKKYRGVAFREGSIFFNIRQLWRLELQATDTYRQAQP